MYDKYSFVLNWYDIPEETRTEKIDEYIKKSFEDAGDTEMTLEEALLDYEVREEVNSNISAHFPIYF